MKIRKFLKVLGLGTVAVETLSPLLLDVIESQYTEELSEIPEFPGLDCSKFCVSFKHKLGIGDILSYDPEFGEQLIIVDNRNFPEHEVRMHTNDKTRFFLTDKLKRGTVYYKLCAYYQGELVYSVSDSSTQLTIVV